VILKTVPAVLLVLGGGALAAQSPTLPGPSAAVPVEIVVLDRDGRNADNLTPANFAVAVDGKPRRVVWVRHVSRGPGASEEAAQRQAGRTDALSFAAEPARNVLVVVDQYSIQRGSERTVNQAAGALVDRLGLDDRVGVLRVPVARDALLALTTERPEVRDALRQVVGQAAQSAGFGADQVLAQPPTGGTDPSRAVGDPDRAAVAEPPRQANEGQARGRAGEDETGVSGFLPNLLGVLTSLRESRGRKIVAVFSAGLPDTSAAGVDDVARAAVAAHATIYAIGLPGAREDAANPLDVRALERLARATGGAFTMLGKNPDQSLARVMPELASCYVLGIEPVAGDADGSRHTLRVETPRQPLVVRAPGWLVARPDVDDIVPSSTAPAPGGGVSATPAAGAPTGAAVLARPGAPTGPAPETGSPRPGDLEAQRLVARAADYIAGYQREYSMLVAEENYIQSINKGERQQIRSDLLLVRPEHADGWVSFRDVFEVNGQPVRDRDDRLKRLFLDPSTEAQSQLNLIKTESARYNIGPARNINVPLFAMKFLEERNLWRCRFRLGGTQDVGGVVSTRIDFQEAGQPTLVQLDMERDLAARGWFLIDPSSGAVTGSGMVLRFTDGSTLEFIVRYSRDEKLGLWVPMDMREVLSRPRTAGSTDNAVAADSRASYSKFRRFQVKSDTEIKVVK
jgi:VWFA-related protein